MTDISLIICTSNRAAALRETLLSMASVRVPEGMKAELLVVDNASTDDTPAVVQNSTLSQMPVRYVREERRGLSRARNTALAQAHGDLLLWTDDDVRPPADWAERMAAPLVSGEASGVTGGVRLAPHLKRAWMKPLHLGLLASTELVPPDMQMPTMLGANMAFARDVLRAVPSFDTELGAGALGFYEDSLFSLQMKQAGLPIATRLDVQVEHHPAPDRLAHTSFLARMRGEGRGQAYVTYHWNHGLLKEDPWAFPDQPIRRVSYWLARRSLQLAVLRLLRPWRGGAEGAAEWEMRKVQQIAFYHQYRKEMRRPRAYDLHGLRKKT